LAGSDVADVKRLHEQLEESNCAGLDMELAIIEDEYHGTMIAAGLLRGLRTVFE
jgi:hypothetical protein